MTSLGQSFVRNRLLQKLTPDDFGLLQPHLEAVELGLKAVLVEANTPIESVWFIEEGLGSIVAVGPDDEQVEVAHVGPDGMVGKSAILGVDQSTNRTFMQVAGSGLRLRVSWFRSALESSPTLRPFLLRYVHVSMTQLSQTALANGRYNLQERLARWLLMCQDRLGGAEMPLTHEFLSLMLGVRRSGVTEAIHLLEGIHVIKATRGQVRILQRERLEEIAGGSYGLPEAEYARLIG
jgi:CRP-like cAMP-binding protein